MRIAFAVAILAYALLALVVLATVAFAETPCGPRDAVIHSFEDEYGETQQDAGIVYRDGEPKAVLEIYANPETGTWTAFIAGTDGQVCMVASGQGWTHAPQPRKGDPA